MAHLTDMEELLSTIKPALIQDYMREAMNCYMASAYRGCIVLSYIALFEDIYDKLGELGKVNKIAKTIHTDVTKKKNDQEIFEKYLIDQLSCKNLMPELDTEFINILKTLRNKSAHPSGHKPSPEEARFIFFEVINRFLSKPILTTTQLVQDIIARLVNTNFFIDTNIDSIESFVREELASLHDEAIPFLVKELSDRILSTDKNVFLNAKSFLLGFARLKNPIATKAIKTYIIESKADNANYADLILSLITVDAKCILDITDTCLSRIKKIINDKIANPDFIPNETNLSHPLHVFASLVRNFDDEVFLRLFNEEFNLLLGHYYHSPVLVGLFDNHSKIFNLYFELILTKISSLSGWYMLLRIVALLNDTDEKLSQKINHQQAFKLILAVDKVAITPAFTSIDLRNEHYIRIPNIKQKATDFYNNSNTEALEMLNENFNNDQQQIDSFLINLDIKAPPTPPLTEQPQ